MHPVASTASMYRAQDLTSAPDSSHGIPEPTLVLMRPHMSRLSPMCPVCPVTSVPGLYPVPSEHAPHTPPKR
jgi:hypothetical protein